VAIQKLAGETGRVPLWLHDAMAELLPGPAEPLAA
jgi:hypothetical protein